MIKKNVAIIGGGIGGLTAAALLAKDGFTVDLFEASREWGGCAGKFHRGPYTFPVGATLGMGFEKGGIHERILRDLNISIKTKVLDEVMMINFPAAQLVFYKDRKTHVRKMQEAFPGIEEQLQHFYAELYKIAAEIRKLMTYLPILPPSTIHEWSILLQSLSFTSISLLPLFPKKLSYLLKKYGLEEEELFKEFLDGLIIDSMQTTSEECSLLLGCLALDIYHEGAFYVEGGLYKLAEALVTSVKENHGTAKLSRRIVSIDQNDHGWLIKDQRDNEYLYDHIVFNGHLKQLEKLLTDKQYGRLNKRIKTRTTQRQWGTFTLYIALQEELLPTDMPLFQQVIAPGGNGMSEGDHIFLSLSASNDIDRAPSGKRTLTVSTHLNLETWEQLEDKEGFKKKMINKMQSVVKRVIPNLEEALITLVPGSPHAWETYTLRENGEVGGYPQTPEYSLFNSISHRSGLRNFWLCGDSVFPGAGTIGVSVSGYHVYQSIKRQMIP